jgi:tetratricopeptide (TPR) repeat protein
LDDPAEDYTAQGYEAFNEATPVGNSRARHLFEAALDLKPNSGAYFGLGSTLWYPWTVQWESDPTSLDNSIEMGHKAIAVDDVRGRITGQWILAEAYASQSKFETAAEAAKRAIDVYPGLAPSHAMLAQVLNYFGKPSEALDELKRATELDARDKHLDLVGWSLGLLRKYDESIASEREFVAKNSNPLLSHLVLAFDYVQIGRLDAAHTEAKEILRISPKYTTEGMRVHTPYRDPNETGRWVAALRQAGLN